VNWYGWIWQHNQWQRVTGPYATLSECSRALERIGEARGVPGKFQVVTAGGAPRFTPTPTDRSAVRTTRRPCRMTSEDA
jgi:hypothetical protein